MRVNLEDEHRERKAVEGALDFYTGNHNEVLQSIEFYYVRPRGVEGLVGGPGDVKVNRKEACRLRDELVSGGEIAHIHVESGIVAGWYRNSATIEYEDGSIFGPLFVQEDGIGNVFLMVQKDGGTAGTAVSMVESYLEPGEFVKLVHLPAVICAFINGR